MSNTKRNTTNIEEQSIEMNQNSNYKEGAIQFSRFVKRPERYKNNEVYLRVRMDGLYGGWRLRDEVFHGFGFIPGDALFLNDIYVLGIDKLDVDTSNWIVDCFASDEAADWLEDNNVKQGTIFEGRFRFAYETVKKGAGSRGSIEAVDAKIANLILLEGMRVIAHNSVQIEKEHTISIPAHTLLGLGLNDE